MNKTTILSITLCATMGVVQWYHDSDQIGQGARVLNLSILNPEGEHFDTRVPYFAEYYQISTASPSGSFGPSSTRNSVTLTYYFG
jgi:hypothetical protein